jgi:hypothetical protein
VRRMAKSWWGEAPERPSKSRNAASLAQAKGSSSRKSCRAGPRVYHVLDRTGRWDRLGSEPVLLRVSVRNRVALFDFSRPFRSLAPPTFSPYGLFRNPALSLLP